MHNKKAIIERTKRIIGQIQGLQHMVEEGQPTDSIMNQVKSVEAAVWQLGVTILKDYCDGLSAPQLAIAMECMEILLQALPDGHDLSQACSQN